MKFLRSLSLILALFFLAPIQAKEWPIYRNGILLFSGPQNLIPNAGELCRTLKSQNVEITNPSCREEGTFARNLNLKTYTEWLIKNAVPQARLKDLATRDNEVKAWFEKYKWNHLILVIEQEDSIKLALFWGGSPYPKAIKSFSKKDDSAIELKMANSFFVGETERMLSEKERESQQIYADAYYSEKIINDTYITFSLDKIIGFGDPQKTGFREYRYNVSQDSSSQFDWTENEATAFQFSVGKGFNGMFNFGLIASYAKFEANYDKATHLNINEWYYERIDLGLEFLIGNTFKLNESLDFYPYVYTRFMYTWMNETFDQKNSPAAADIRVTLPTVKGGSAGIGIRTLWDGSHGIDFTLGLSHRGIVAKEAFNPDPQEVIGGSTNEYWFGIKYWLNFRYLE